MISLSKKEFDNIILDNLLDYDGKNRPLLRLSEPKYRCYYTDAEFQRFCNDMAQHYPGAYASYYYGKGHEMQAKKNGYPKMASVASSSRFCFLALCRGAQAIGGSDDIVFEASCKFKGSRAPAQLDAFDAASNIYFEVKCHEIFDEPERFRPSYKEFFKTKNKDFGFKDINFYDPNPKGELLIDLYDGKRIEIPRFNVKQFICHLMGIADNKKDDTPATLIYLFFKPKNEKYQMAIDNVFEELKSSIRLAFENDHIKGFCIKHRINLKAIAEYDIIMRELTKDNIEILY